MVPATNLPILKDARTLMVAAASLPRFQVALTLLVFDATVLLVWHLPCPQTVSVRLVDGSLVDSKFALTLPFGFSFGGVLLLPLTGPFVPPIPQTA